MLDKIRSTSVLLCVAAIVAGGSLANTSSASLRLPYPYGSGDWQLYDLANDPGELHDLASEFPERVEYLAKAWDNYAKSNGVIQPNTVTAYAKPVVGRKNNGKLWGNRHERPSRNGQLVKACP